MNNRKFNLLNPWALTGIIDAEGSFGVVVVKDKTRSSGFVITVFLEVGLNVVDKDLLERIKATLGVGNIYLKSSDNTYRWKVSNINDLCAMREHYI